jgi:hypothetical protein
LINVRLREASLDCVPLPVTYDFDSDRPVDSTILGDNQFKVAEVDMDDLDDPDDPYNNLGAGPDDWV